eukprot:3780121-Pyramimonas_sp.AAC.2
MGMALMYEAVHDQALSKYLRQNPKAAKVFANLGNPDPLRQAGMAMTNARANANVIQSRINSYATQNKFSDAAFRQQIQKQTNQNYLQSQIQMKTNQLEELRQQ